MELQKLVILLKKNFIINIWKIKNIIKLEIVVIIQGNIKVLRIKKCGVPKKIPLAFHNRSNCDHFFTEYKNEHKVRNLWLQKTLKNYFYKNKKAFQIDDIDANKILFSKKGPYGKNNSPIYFTGYDDNDVIRPLCLRRPQVTGYAKKFNENVTISFRVNNKQSLQNCNKIWEKVERLMRIDFDSKPV